MPSQNPALHGLRIGSVRTEFGGGLPGGWTLDSRFSPQSSFNDHLPAKSARYLKLIFLHFRIRREVQGLLAEPHVGGGRLTNPFRGYSPRFRTRRVVLAIRTCGASSRT